MGSAIIVRDAGPIRGEHFTMAGVRFCCGEERSRDGRTVLQRAAHRRDSLAALGMPLYTLDDSKTPTSRARIGRTRGRSFVRSIADRHRGSVVKDAHPIVDRAARQEEPGRNRTAAPRRGDQPEGHRARCSRRCRNTSTSSKQSWNTTYSTRRLAPGVWIDRRFGSERDATALHEGSRRDRRARSS